MKKEMLTKARKLSWIINREKNDYFPLKSLCGLLSDMTDSNVYILDKDGEILSGCYKLINQFTNEMQKKPNEEQSFSKKSEISKGLNRMTDFDWRKQLSIAYQCDIDSKYQHIVPINSCLNHVGDVFISRHLSPFNDEDLALIEFSAAILGLKTQNIIDRKNHDKIRKAEVVKLALSSLSYSEREAIKAVLDALKSVEGVIIVSNVAERGNMTRTTIVNAIRKIESAGIIKSKSLGMKGTYIQVLNKSILDLELKSEYEYFKSNS